MYLKIFFKKIKVSIPGVYRGDDMKKCGIAKLHDVLSKHIQPKSFKRPCNFIDLYFFKKKMF